MHRSIMHRSIYNFAQSATPTTTAYLQIVPVAHPYQQRTRHPCVKGNRIIKQVTNCLDYPYPAHPVGLPQKHGGVSVNIKNSLLSTSSPRCRWVAGLEALPARCLLVCAIHGYYEVAIFSMLIPYPLPPFCNNTVLAFYILIDLNVIVFELLSRALICSAHVLALTASSCRPHFRMLFCGTISIFP